MVGKANRNLGIFLSANRFGDFGLFVGVAVSSRHLMLGPRAGRLGRCHTRSVIGGSTISSTEKMETLGLIGEEGESLLKHKTTHN